MSLLQVQAPVQRRVPATPSMFTSVKMTGVPAGPSFIPPGLYLYEIHVVNLYSMLCNHAIYTIMLAHDCAYGISTCKLNPWIAVLVLVQ